VVVDAAILVVDVPTEEDMVVVVVVAAAAMADAVISEAVVVIVERNRATVGIRAIIKATKEATKRVDVPAKTSLIVADNRSSLPRTTSRDTRTIGLPLQHLRRASSKIGISSFLSNNLRSNHHQEAVARTRTANSGSGRRGSENVNSSNSNSNNSSNNNSLKNNKTLLQHPLGLPIPMLT
jgi:hypothetical protein